MFLQETLNNQGSHDAWDSLNQTRYHRFPYINILATVFGRSKKEALLPPHGFALHGTLTPCSDVVSMFLGIIYLICSDPYSQLRKKERGQTGETPSPPGICTPL